MEHQDILPILQQILGQSKKSTHKSGHENYAFFCPLCHHYKPKLEIDLVSGYWHCWKCDAKGKSPYSLLKRLSSDRQVLAYIRNKYRDTHDYIKPQASSIVVSLPILPSEFISLSNSSSGSIFQKLANSYLEKRGVTSQDIARYGIGYCESGVYDDKIIVPNYDNSGKLNFFIGRSYNPNAEYKFQSPSADKDFIGFELYISWKFPVILCEGVFDAIAIRNNAIPLYGKTISKKLKEKIIQEKPPRVYIALDPDAVKDAAKIAEYFVSNGIETYQIELKEGDPSEIGYDKFWKLVESAKKIEIADSFEMKIKMML